MNSEVKKGLRVAGAATLVLLVMLAGFVVGLVDHQRRHTTSVASYDYYADYPGPDYWVEYPPVE